MSFGRVAMRPGRFGDDDVLATSPWLMLDDAFGGIINFA
jgi:hypothetical protein